jgi:LysR family hydrogen peroxide-inducible transcriptional activator
MIGEPRTGPANALHHFRSHGPALALLSEREMIPPLQMHQVRYFLALCEELNFHRAARRCGISQPSLTTAIRALELELGGALFHREPSVALTRLGRAVRPYLDKIARNADHAREVARTVTPRRRALGK